MSHRSQSHGQIAALRYNKEKKYNRMTGMRGEIMTEIRLATVNIDCPDAHALAAFYARLLGWGIGWEDEDFVILRDPAGGVGLSFQTEPCYVAPVWPDEPGQPGKSMHLDLQVTDLEKATAQAVAAGAVMASEQFLDGVRVFLDPAGHPFCLFLD